jgi:hypothetical protein
LREPQKYLGQRAALLPLLRFYRIARVPLAPTPEQVRWLEQSTGRPAFLMPRGVDCEQFHPRQRSVKDGVRRLGYVGRVTLEKRVRFLVDLERALVVAGYSNFSILVVGDGNERAWLERNLGHGVFTGVLRGQFLAEAYANMDVFVFPSRTDTYGNVVQEAARFWGACGCDGTRWATMPGRAGRDGICRGKRPRIHTKHSTADGGARTHALDGSGSAPKYSVKILGCRSGNDVFRLSFLKGCRACGEARGRRPGAGPAAGVGGLTGRGVSGLERC